MDGVPQGKGRPRSVRARKKPYTPKKTIAYEHRVRTALLMAYFRAEGRAMSGEKSLFGAEAIDAEILAYYPLPKNCSKMAERRMNLGLSRPTKRPDLDNIAKSILDALNHLAYDDDSQVVKLTVNKFYCRAGEERAEITIRPWRS